MADEVTLTIDGNAVTVPKGTLLVEAAKTIDTDVPVYCYHAKLGPAGLCRICLVDVEKTPKLQIACNTVASDGMVVHTYGPKVEEGRRAVLEFLLLNHPLDCPICDKGGECDLQDYSMAYGQGSSRLADPKASKPKAIDLGPTIVLDDTRCIVCQRCSRFDDLITHEQSLVVKDRGARDVIATATGEPYVSNFSGNVTELCPVGALTSKTYRFKSRPWDLHRTLTTCTQCSVGCAQYLDVRHGEALRTMSEGTDDDRSDGWLCDRGRYNIGFLSDPRRVTSPLLRSGDEWNQISWDDALALWASKLQEALAGAGAASVGAIGGGRLLNEEAYLLQSVFRGLGVQNLDWRAGRQNHASPGGTGTYVDLENAQTILVVGQPPAQTAPVMDLRIRKAVARRGARLVSVGPFAAGSFVPEVHVADFAALDPALLAVERIAVVWDGIDETLGAAAIAALAPAVRAGAHVATFIPGEQPNARGAESMGMLPASGGLDTRGMFEAAAAGRLAVLSLFGVNPVLRYVDGALARRAIEAVPFVVATELFLTETSSLANLVLPAKYAHEKSGHTTDLQGFAQRVNAGNDAPGETLADGEILVALAAELGVAIPAPNELEALAAEPRRTMSAVAGPPRGGNGTPEPGATLRVAIATHPFSGGGTMRFDDRLHDVRPRPAVVLAAATAAALGAIAGDTLDLTGARAALQGLVVRIEPGAAAGVAVVFDGLSDAPANLLSAGEAVTVALRTAREPALAGGPA